MKFALFLICALTAVQGFQAPSLLFNVERDMIDTIQNINGVINKIKENIDYVTSQILGIIPNKKDKINEIINKVQEMIQVAGEINHECVKDLSDSVEIVNAYTQEQINECVSKAEDKTEALKNKLNILVGKLQTLRDDIVSHTRKCADDNKTNPVGLSNCLRDRVKPLIDNVAVIEQEAAHTIADVKQTTQVIATDVVQCFTNIEELIDPSAAFDTINDCIQQSIN